MKRIVHFEIGCNDIEKTSAFYRSVFDWNMTRHGNSSIMHTGDENALSGHINQLGPEDLQRYVTLYIETTTLEKDLEAIENNGGKIMVKPVNLPDGRKFAWFEDNAGNILGLITPQNAQSIMK